MVVVFHMALLTYCEMDEVLL